MMNRVKLLLTGLSRRQPCSPLAVALLDASAIEQATSSVAIELLAAGAAEPPEWVRFLAPGVNRARDGRSFTVADVDQVVQLSTQYKGSIDLLVDWEHQFDHAKQNGQRAEAAAWITQLAAKGPDGSPGVWAKVEWLPETAALIKARKYRYLSAAVAHDAQNVVQFVPRASLTNQPALDTATALFAAQPTKENDVTLLQKLLAALGLAAATTEDKALEIAKGMATLAAALAKSMNVDVVALSAMTADQVAGALAKPFSDKLATLAAQAKVSVDAAPDVIVSGLRSLGVDPAAYVPMSVHQEVSTRLTTLNAQRRASVIEEGKKAGKLSPGMIDSDWMKASTTEQIVAYLSTAAVIVPPGAEQRTAEPNVSTLSADEKAAAKAAGVTEEAFLEAKKVEADITSRRTAQLG